MKELEDTPCEVKRIVELQLSLCHSNLVEEKEPEEDDDKPLANFFEDTNYGWLSNGSKLTVFNTKTGATISCWVFKDRITCVDQFPSQPGEIPLLLVGLTSDSNRIRESVGMICVFSCTSSQILRSIRMPVGVERVCVINGGADWEEMNDLSIENEGMVCVALKNVNYYLIDLKRNSWKNTLDLVHNEESHPADLDLQDSKNSSRSRVTVEKHPVYKLMTEEMEHYMEFNREEFESSIINKESTTALIYSSKIGCIIVGCLGRIIIWRNDGVVQWLSTQIKNMYISNLALLEPTDDPRPFCYLWASYQKESSSIAPVLRMYAMLFERKDVEKGLNLYYNLEGEPSLKFEMELKDNSKVKSLCPIIRDNNQEQNEFGTKHGEDSVLLISTDKRTYLFDLNQWYKEQMPRFIGDCPNVNAIVVSYKTITDKTDPDNLKLTSRYVPSTLSEFRSSCATSPEEFFYPNSLSLKWIELGIKQIVTWMTYGVQLQLLKDIASAGPTVILQPSETFHRCISNGLIAFNPDMGYIDDVNNQRNSLLSLCLEQRWTSFLLKCAKDWSDGSAVYLYPEFIRWIIQSASSIQHNAHQLCIPLFDQSGSNIGESEVKVLRYFSQQMECLCNIVKNLSIDTDDFNNKKRGLSRISIHLQVLLWFYDVGLLPETQDCDNDDKKNDDDDEEEMEEGEMEKELPFSFSYKIPYPVDKLTEIYSKKRKLNSEISTKKNDKEKNLFIDELITRECPGLQSQWEQESHEIRNNNGNYPPPSLQSLLRSFLSDCCNSNSSENSEMNHKHQIITYLLMDLVRILQNSCTEIDQLIKYPSAFKLSPSLIKLTQALWSLDQGYYQNFLDIITGQLVSESDIKDWHHKLIMRVLLQNNQNKMALIYLKIRKPPLNSIDDQSTVINLSVEYGLIQSAFNRRPLSHYNQLLMKFFKVCKKHNKLYEILHLALSSDEEQIFMKFLEKEKCKDIQMIYYLQRCRYTEANFVLTNDEKNNKSVCTSLFQAYNATLPEITRKFSSQLTRKTIEPDLESGYPLPMSHFKSQYKSNEMYENFIKKAKETFIHRNSNFIPFLSAPCSSLINQFSNSDSNCVVYAERIVKTGRKRGIDEVREDEKFEESVQNKKRRKINENSYKTNENNAIMFSTPLIKKKYQTEKSGPPETPQSILKIRQIIRSSTSPANTKKLMFNDEEITTIKEKRPRQIRFSINQPRSAESTVEDMSYDNDNDEIQKDKLKRDDSEESDNPYFSPNASTASMNESSKSSLSSLSSQSKAVSGPRPRPSLRKNSADKLKDHSLISTMDSSTDFDNIPEKILEKFNTSKVASSSMINLNTSKSDIKKRESFSTSVYEKTALSPGSLLDWSNNDNGKDSSCEAIISYHSSTSTCKNETENSTHELSTSKPEQSNFEQKYSTSIYEKTALSLGSFVDQSYHKNDLTDEAFMSYHSSTSVLKDEIANSSETDKDNSKCSEEIASKSLNYTSIYDPTLLTSDMSSSFDNSKMNVPEGFKSTLSYHSDSDQKEKVDCLTSEVLEEAAEVETKSSSNETFDQLKLPETNTDSSIYEKSALSDSVDNSNCFENSDKMPDGFRSTLSYHSDLNAVEKADLILDELVDAANVEIQSPTAEESECQSEDKDATSKENVDEIIPSDIPEDINIDDDKDQNNEKFKRFSESGDIKIYEISKSNDVQEIIKPIQIDEYDITDDDSSSDLKVLTVSEDVNITDDESVNSISYEKSSKTPEIIEIANDVEDECELVEEQCPDEIHLEEESSVSPEKDTISSESPLESSEQIPSSSEEIHEETNDDKYSDKIDLVEEKDSITVANEIISSELVKTSEQVANDETECNEESPEETMLVEESGLTPVKEETNDEETISKKVGSELEKIEEAAEESHVEIVSKENVSETSKRVGRPRRSSSVAPESVAEKSVSKRGRRSTSLMKEVVPLIPIVKLSKDESLNSKSLAASKRNDDLTLDAEVEVPTKRRGRRAASIQKEFVEEVSESGQLDVNEKTGENDDNIENVKKSTRGRRAASITKDFHVTTRRGAASVSKETTDDVPLKNTKKKRAASVSKESIGEKTKVHLSSNSLSDESLQIFEFTSKTSQKSKEIDESASSNETTDNIPIRNTRKTRAASVSKETADDVSLKNTRKTRETSISKESTNEKPKRTRKTSVMNDVDESTTRKTRASSIAKDLDDSTSSNETTDNIPIRNTRKTRAASISKESDGDVSLKNTRKTREASIPKEPTNDKPKRTRSTSTTNDADESISRRTRATSVTQDVENIISRRTRASSVTKDLDESTSRMTRASSLSKDLPVTPVTRRRSTRSSSVTKEIEEAAETSVKTTRRRRGSLVAEVIPEEDVISSTSRPKRNRKQTLEIAAIPSITEEEVDAFSSNEPPSKRRNTRAASVDVTEDAEDESGNKVTSRRRRAASETKDTKTKSTTKVTRKKKESSCDLESTRKESKKSVPRIIKKFLPDSLLNLEPEVKKCQDKNSSNQNSKIFNKVSHKLKYRKEFIIRR